jgi:hypothetical protein
MKISNKHGRRPKKKEDDLKKMMEDDLKKKENDLNKNINGTRPKAQLKKSAVIGCDIIVN